MSLCKIPKLKYKNIRLKSLPGSITHFFHKSSVKYLLFQKGTPRCTCFGGVLTLEAAVIMPLLACFFVSILFFFRVLQIQLEVQKALDDTGRKMAVYMAAGDESSNEAIGMTVAKAMFLRELVGDKNVTRYIRGGSLGISLAESELGQEEVDFLAVYRVNFPIGLLGKRDILVVQRAKCRKWTGWQGGREDDSGDAWVYVTETGAVYHRVESCTYLKLTITSISSANIGELRNENGGKYYGCEVCTKQSAMPIRVYITGQGSRYHYRLACRGLRRIVSMIRLSEIEGRRACSKCKQTSNGGVGSGTR